MNYVTVSREDTQSFAGKIGRYLVSGDVVLLYGEIGMGKSVIARAAARRLGVLCDMPSPTFTLMQPYMGSVKVYHFDLYRLGDLDEYYEAGLDEFARGDGVSFIEWPIEGMEFAGPTVLIKISRGDGENSRNITVEAIGMDSRREALFSALSAWEVKNDDSRG